MKLADLPLSCGSLSVKYFLFILLLIIHLSEEVCIYNVMRKTPSYHAIEGGNISVECPINCSIDCSGKPYVLWHLQAPETHREQLDSQTTSTESKYGVKIGFRNKDVPCTGGTESYFLDISGVKANMNHSVIKCGVNEDYIGLVIYLIVHRIEPVVMGTNEIYYATEIGVTLSCLHSCNWTSLYPNYLLLWKLQTFDHQLGTFALHYNSTRIMAEDELEVNFNITSDNSCSLGDEFNTFYLDIVGMSALLQHAVVSCGVRVDMDSPEIYSSTDSYIVINDTTVEATRVANYATDSGVRIQCSYLCLGMSVATSYLWILKTFKLGAVELHNSTSKKDIETRLPVRFKMTSDDSCNSNTGRSNFYLDILGMSPLLQHAVVSCGVRADMDSPEIYSSTDSYIVINQTNVTMATTGNYARDSRVQIECTHTCRNEQEFQYLWIIQVFGFRDLKPQYLHNNQVRMTMEKELSININMSSDNNCNENSMKSFFLSISGISNSLQHAVVSCGVNTSTEVYSTHNGYIIIPVIDKGTENEPVIALSAVVGILVACGIGVVLATLIVYLCRRMQHAELAQNVAGNIQENVEAVNPMEDINGENVEMNEI